MEEYFTLSENLEKMTETIERTYRFLDQSDPKALQNIQKAIGLHAARSMLHLPRRQEDQFDHPIAGCLREISNLRRTSPMSRGQLIGSVGHVEFAVGKIDD
jgi:hypothetical protein